MSPFHERGADAKNINNKILILLACAFALRLLFSFRYEGSDVTFFLNIGDYWVKTGRSPYNFSWPYQYPPLYLYIVRAARLLSGGDYVLYRVLAKLPQIFGDVMIGWIIIRMALRKTSSERRALAAGIFYLFNPLLIYNCAYYGRFDQISSFFAVAGFALYETSVVSSFLFAAAFCAKTYTLFFFPYFLFKDRKRLVIAGLAFAVVLSALSLPLVMKYHNTSETFTIMFNLARHWPLGLSWQTVLYRVFDVNQIMVISRFVLMSYLALLVVFPKRDFLSYAAFSLAMFPLFSMISFEQYMTWSIPFLVMDFWINNKRHAIAMAVVFTVVGMSSNQTIQIMDIAGLPQSLLNIAYSFCMIAYAAAEFAWLRRNGGNLSLFRAGNEMERAAAGAAGTAS